MAQLNCQSHEQAWIARYVYILIKRLYENEQFRSIMNNWNCNSLLEIIC